MKISKYRILFNIVNDKEEELEDEVCKLSYLLMYLKSGNPNWAKGYPNKWGEDVEDIRRWILFRQKRSPCFQ